MRPLPDALYHLSRYEGMLDSRRPVESWWQVISEYVLPRKSFVTDSEDFVDDSRFRRLYDTTAIDACNTLANGHASYITPGDQRWFYWSAPEHVYTDETEEWYRRCSEIAALELAASNFYSSVNEAYLDRSGFGLANVSFWPGKRRSLACRVHPVNSYAIEEDEEGMVDVVYFEMKLGVRQLHNMFGDEILRSPKLAESWGKLNESGKNQEHSIIHCVYPRSERDTKSREGRNMPIASVYLCKEGKTVISESGFEEMPYCVTRFLKHTGRGDQYGFSPSWRAMPTIAQLNFLQKAMDVVAEKQAFPSILVPDYLEGDVDLRAGGMTMFKANRVKGAYALPQEWGSQGRYDVGIHRVEQKKEEINRAFHVDLFRMFSELDRPNMTATEVAERAGEKMVQFSPSFTRFISDFQVAMERVFAILLRAGRFPEPPPSAIQINPYSGAVSVESPKVVYQSKIALALQQLQNSGLDRLMERMLLIAEKTGRLDVLDNVDLDAAVRTYARNDGVPEKVLSSEETMEEIRAARQQQMEEERQLAMAAEGAKAASAVGLTM